MNLVIGITGASGSCYARRLIEVLAAGEHSCHIIVSRAGKAVLAHEINESPADWPDSLAGGENLTLWKSDNLFAPFCSGSNPPSACPNAGAAARRRTEAATMLVRNRMGRID